MTELFTWLASLLPARWRAIAVRFAGYVGVSGAAWLVDMTIYGLLLKPAGIAAIAAIGGYLSGMIAHYTLSSRIVFRDVLVRRGVAAETPVFGKFVLAGVTGLCVTTAIVFLIADVAGFNPVLAKLVATAASFATVFTLLRLMVLRDAFRLAPVVPR